MLTLTSTCKVDLIREPKVEEAQAGPGPEFRYRVKSSWGRLIKKIREVDPMICPHCGAEMRIPAGVRPASGASASPKVPTFGEYYRTRTGDRANLRYIVAWDPQPPFRGPHEPADCPVHRYR
ncbi:MAG: hypothetical protein O6938_03245 [Gammaproteobacteria bacterium]|nr:hypothetical protein [Gammaproteobacteria bacterium]